MEFFKPNLYIDFMSRRRLCFILSLSAVIASIVLIIVPGPNYGVDFRGGTELEVRFKRPVTAGQVRSAMSKLGHNDAQVVSAPGKPGQFIIRVGAVTAVTAAQRRQVERNVRQTFRTQRVVDFNFSPGGDSITIRSAQPIGEDQLRQQITAANLRVEELSHDSAGDEQRYRITLVGLADTLMTGMSRIMGSSTVPDHAARVEWVGPKAGAQLRDAAIKAMIFAMLFIMVYVAFRFDLRFAPGAIIGMLHDLIINVGVIVALRMEFSLAVVAALLTGIGYGINDTVVCYDRIRENMQRSRNKSFADLINLSLSQNLGRTLLTGVTVIFTLGAFIIFGTTAIRNMALTTLIGMVITTYSSIMVAAPLTEWMDRQFFTKRAASAKTSKA